MHNHSNYWIPSPTIVLSLNFLKISELPVRKIYHSDLRCFNPLDGVNLWDVLQLLKPKIEFNEESI